MNYWQTTEILSTLTSRINSKWYNRGIGDHEVQNHEHQNLNNTINTNIYHQIITANYDY